MIYKQIYHCVLRELLFNVINLHGLLLVFFVRIDFFFRISRLLWIQLYSICSFMFSLKKGEGRTLQSVLHASHICSSIWTMLFLLPENVQATTLTLVSI